MVEPGRPQMALWRMRTARWIPKASNKHSEYVILTAFTVQQWLQERAPLLRCTYVAGLVRTSPVAILTKFTVNSHGKSVHLSLIQGYS